MEWLAPGNIQNLPLFFKISISVFELNCLPSVVFPIYLKWTNPPDPIKKNPVILHFYVTLTFFISISPTPFFLPSAYFQSIILPNVSKIWDHPRTNVKFCWYGILWFVFQSLSHVWLLVTPWAAACQASLSFTISPSLLKLCI